MKDDWQTIAQAAKLTGVGRNTIAKWVAAGLIEGRPSKVRNLVATLVSVKAVRELRKKRPPGRPRKTPAK